MFPLFEAFRNISLCTFWTCLVQVWFKFWVQTIKNSTKNVKDQPTNHPVRPKKQASPTPTFSLLHDRTWEESHITRKEIVPYLKLPANSSISSVSLVPCPWKFRYIYPITLRIHSPYSSQQSAARLPKFWAGIDLLPPPLTSSRGCRRRLAQP